MNNKDILKILELPEAEKFYGFKNISKFEKIKQGKSSDLYLETRHDFEGLYKEFEKEFSDITGVILLIMLSSEFLAHLLCSFSDEDFKTFMTASTFLGIQDNMNRIDDFHKSKQTH
jgi:hypothetical protein